MRDISDKSREPKDEKEKLPSNVVRIEKENGKFDLVYEFHTRNVNPKSVSRECDAVFLEMSSNKYLQADEYGRHPFSDDLEQRSPYTELMKDLRENTERVVSPAVLYGDLKFKSNFSVMSLEVMKAMLETAIGVALLGKVYEDYKNYKKEGEGFSRRNFLRMGAGSLLLAPVIDHIIGSGMFFTGSKSNTAVNFSKRVQKVVSKLRPDDGFLSLTVRNVVMAHKLDWYASRKMEEAKESGDFDPETDKPHLALIVGAGHFGVEKYLKNSPKERVDFLKVFFPLLKKVIDVETFYKIVVAYCVRGDKKWKAIIHDIPDLKGMVGS